MVFVITSYSIHYTKLYDQTQQPLGPDPLCIAGVEGATDHRADDVDAEEQAEVTLGDPIKLDAPLLILHGDADAMIPVRLVV